MLFPVIFSFHPKIKFHLQWKKFFLGNLPVAAFFIFWDAVFTEKGIWGFNPDYVTGIYLYNLPIEEVLFFICIPFASLFTWHVLKKNLPSFQLSSRLIRIITIFFIVAFAIMAMMFYQKAYTFYAFSMAAISLLFVYLKKKEMLPHFYLMYVIILIPFFIVNGILTGTGIEGEVVWYNDQENLGVRMLTIPVEDTFYGFALLLLNAFLMEVFSGRKVIQPETKR